MITSKYITRIIGAAMAAAVLGCFLAMLFSQEFVEAFGGSTLAMQYQAALFDTEQVMQVNVIMEETEWEDMLANASAEEYYSCDVVINGQRVNHVGIRPKGNTSLSAIVQDPGSDRYSLKLEFDHYVEGQTYLGLDKLILNNNYADATNMKEALIYDMYQYLGADASLYNYAEISVNGEYWGVYLALEAVEDSFLLRNYGAEDGALYKPESMGGGGSFDGADFGFRNRDRQGQEAGNGELEAGGFFPGNGMPEMGNFPGGEATEADRSFPGRGMPGTDGAAPGEGMPGTDGAAPGEGMPGTGEATPGEGMPGTGEAVPGEGMPGTDGAAPGEGMSGTDGAAPGEGMPGTGEAAPGEGMLGMDGAAPGEGISGTDGAAPEERMPGTDGAAPGEDMPRQSENIPDSRGDIGGLGSADRERAAGGRGPSMGGSGSDLNYTDDDLESYSAIWEGEVKNTGEKDHRRVVTALKNISEGTELETYLDVDNVLKYMAVHTFAVNMDSLSGNMAHNYYLYEYNGKLNLIPWDYNLSFGGMSMGAAGNASEMVNYAIDTPFQGTEFFDALLEDEEYLSRYHEYMRMLAEEYVLGGRFEEVYNGIRNRIDTLVETDPTAFYSYEEYEAGAGMLYQTVLLRAESILGQLNGTIPSTDAGQRLDASGIDISVMGVFNMGGQRFQFNGVEVSFSEENGETVQDEPALGSAEPQEEGNAVSGMPDKYGQESGLAEPGSQGFPFPGDAVPAMNENIPQDFGAPGFGVPGIFGNAGGIDMQMTAQNIIIFAACLAISLVALLAVKCYQRVPGKHRSEQKRKASIESKL